MQHCKLSECQGAAANSSSLLTVHICAMDTNKIARLYFSRNHVFITSVHSLGICGTTGTGAERPCHPQHPVPLTAFRLASLLGPSKVVSLLGPGFWKPRWPWDSGGPRCCRGTAGLTLSLHIRKLDKFSYLFPAIKCDSSLHVFS